MSNLNEENDPFAMTPPGSYELSRNDSGGHIEIDNESVRDNINNLLAAVTASPAISPYTALERVRKVLAQFHINLPAYTFMEGGSGSTTFEINQFGSRIGMNNGGQVVTKEDSEYTLYFEYTTQDDGKYAVFAEICNEDELQEILDDVEDEMDDELNEEEIEEDVKESKGKLKDTCWKGYTAVGMKNKNGKKVPNCVPVDEAAVDAKGHKSSTGGLTQKGRDHYNSTTGSNLKAPVTTSPSKLDPDSKAANRRKSFCARMGGMEGPMKKPNGEPTRKSLALKKWNCNENADLNEVTSNAIANYKAKALPDEKKRMKELADTYHKDPLRTDPKEGRKWINRVKGLNRAERLLTKNRTKENLKDAYTKESYSMAVRKHDKTTGEKNNVGLISNSHMRRAAARATVKDLNAKHGKDDDKVKVKYRVIDNNKFTKEYIKKRDEKQAKSYDADKKKNHPDLKEATWPDYETSKSGIRSTTIPKEKRAEYEKDTLKKGAEASKVLSQYNRKKKRLKEESLNELSKEKLSKYRRAAETDVGSKYGDLDYDYHGDDLAKASKRDDYIKLAKNKIRNKIRKEKSVKEETMKSYRDFVSEAMQLQRK